MAKPTPMQRYYLFLLWHARVIGIVFAVFAVGITLSNLPSLIREGDHGRLVENVVAGAAFFLIGCALYRLATLVLRKYRAHIASQID